jgi:hypothetical protein
MHTSSKLLVSIALLGNLVACAERTGDTDDPTCQDGKCDDGSEVTPGQRLVAAVDACVGQRSRALDDDDLDDDAVLAIEDTYAACVAKANDAAIPRVDDLYAEIGEDDQTGLLIDFLSDFRTTSLCALIGESALGNTSSIHITTMQCLGTAERWVAHEIGAIAFDTREESAAYDATVGDEVYAGCIAARNAAADAALTQAHLTAAADGFASCVRNRVDELAPAIGARLHEIQPDLSLSEATAQVEASIGLNFGHVNELCSGINGPGLLAGWGVASQTGMCRARGYAEAGKRLADALQVGAP